MSTSYDLTMNYEYACRLLPGGVNSPVRACLPVGVIPPILSSAKGDLFLDNQGRAFLDFCCSWGSLIHGHHHPEIYQVIQEEASKGISYGLTSENELLFASFLLKILDCSNHKIRFVSSGTEATMTAARLACGITKRPIIIKFSGCYHGHSDIFLNELVFHEESLDLLQNLISFRQQSCNGIPIVLSLPYNDPLTLRAVMEKIGDQVAGIIFEPVCANMGIVLPHPEFLSTIFSLCQQFSCLSVMDEVVTGFRCTLYGARSLFNVEPDIITYGKIIGGGLPVAAIIATESIMNYLAPIGPVFQAGTLSGNPLAMATGLKSIQLCTKEGFYETLQASMDAFCQPIEDLIQKHSLPLCLVREHSMFSFFFAETAPTNFKEVKATNQSLFKQFYRLLFDQNIYLSPSPFEANFLSSAHCLHHLNDVSETIIRVLKILF